MQTSEVRDAAAQAVNQSKSFLSRQVDQRTTELGDRAATIAGELRHVSGQLRQSGIAPGADYTDRGAEVVENVARYLRGADGEQLIEDLESLARRQPWTFAAGALVAGFAASRFLKTSSSRRFRSGSAGRYESGGTAYGYDDET